MFRRSRPVPAVVLLRVDPAMHELKKRRLDATIDRFGEKLRGRYTVIEESKISYAAFAASTDRQKIAGRSPAMTMRERFTSLSR